MISEERFNEIKQQGGTIYGIDDDNNIIAIPTNYLHRPKNFNTGVEIKDKLRVAYEIGDGVNIFDVNKDLSNIFEHREEAEFVAKYHCSKTIKFEPPTFEEFEAKGMTHWYCDNIEFDNYYINEFTIREYQLQSEDYDKYSFEYEDNIESRKKAYYQAVEYAKKLFLGDSDDNTK